MGYAILRTQKLKSGIAVRRSMTHAFREQDTPNADPDRLSENTHLGAYNVNDALARFNERLPDKVRKNAVLAIEYLITASPEDMHRRTRQQQDAYFSDAIKWLEDKHGKANVVYAGIHRDEQTPHMYAFVVPIDNRGKLNCRSFLGGAKALTEMQTDFATQVGIKHSLQRGLEGSRARHTSIQQYYGRVNAATLKTPSIDVPEGKFFESKETYANRVANAVLEQMRPELVSLKAKAHHTDLAQQQAKAAEQRREQAEFRAQQRENSLQVERQKAKQNIDKVNELLLTIAKGGQPLANLQAMLKDKIEQNKSREKGRSR